MVRNPCCEKMGLKKGSWTPEEDQILISYIQRHGHDNWRALPKQAGLQRCGKSCRLRWTNYLRPDIKRGNFIREEEEVITKLHGLLGNRWSAIAAQLPGRTDNEIKNFWHTYLKKRLRQSVGTPVALNTDTQNFGHEAIFPQQSQISASYPSMPPAMHPIGAQEKGSLTTVPATDCSLLSRNISATRNYSLLLDQGLPPNFSPDSTTTSTNSSDIIDERGFWYDLLIKAGGSSQPPLNLE